MVTQDHGNDGDNDDNGDDDDDDYDNSSPGWSTTCNALVYARSGEQGE